MLVFIIPVKSKEVAKSWTELSKLFDRCLRSVCNQTSQDFKVIVVCNEKPITSFEHPNVEYLIVDFPPPGADYGAKINDRSKRVIAGILAVKYLQPCYIMSVDADDCISEHIAKFVNQNPENNGWYIEQGYEYDDGSSKIFFKEKGFNRICGTCNIINYRLFKLPNQILAYDQITGYDRFISGHSLAKIDLADRGTPLEPLPFSGAVYVRDQSGESVTIQESFISKWRRNPKETLRDVKKFITSFSNQRIINKELQKEFGLYPLKK